MIETILDSLDDLHEAFDRVDRALSNEDAVDEAVKDASLLPNLKDLERYIQNQALFSPNEEFEDIDIGIVKFLRLPHLLALAHSKQQGPNRVASIKESERYYLIFLDLLHHYSILPSSINLVLDGYKEKGSAFKIEREAKINLYKNEKAAEGELALARNKEAWRDVSRLNLVRCAYQDINALLFIPQELEILNFKRTLETDTDVMVHRRDNRPTHPSDKNGKHHQHGQSDADGQHPGKHQKPNRIDVHGAQGVNLLISGHGADFSCHRGAYPARDQDGHHHGPEFLGHG